MGRSTHRVLLLARKDLLRRWRSPIGVAAMIAFPLVFAGMMALAFGGESALPRARLLVEDRDDGLLGGFVKAAFSAEQVAEFIEMVEVGEEGRQMLENDEASALLVIPQDATTRLFEGEDVELELVRNPAQSILPEIAEQVAVVMADVSSILTRLVRRQIEILDLPDLETIESFEDLPDDQFAKISVALRHTFTEAGNFVAEPPIGFEQVTIGEDEEKPEDDKDMSQMALIFLFVLPGISVYALFVIGDQMMRDVLEESRLGTLRRQLSAPVTAGQVLISKVLVTAVVAGIALLVLAAIAALVTPDPVDLPAFAVLALALVLAVTGCAALIYALAKNDRQGSAISAVIYLTLAFSSGSFIPLDSMPATMRAVAPASPFYWATQGFLDLMHKGAGLAAVLLPVAVLGGGGLVLLAAGTALLQRKVLRGDAK